MKYVWCETCCAIFEYKLVFPFKCEIGAVSTFSSFADSCLQVCSAKTLLKYVNSPICNC